jgi:hypothetical protein
VVKRREDFGEGALLVGVVVFFDEGDGADYVVGDRLAIGELDGSAHGRALPFGADADGPGGCELGPGSDDFLDDGFVGAELGDDGGDSTFGGGGDSAVGGVVAEPDDVGDVGIVVREMEGGDVAGDAVDHEPGGGLPGPAGSFGGQRVVDVEGAADDEGAVGDVVDFADGPLLLNAVDVKGTDVEAGGFFRFVVGVGFGRGVGNAACGAEGDAVDLGGLGGGGDRADKNEKQDSRERDSTGQEHWSWAEGLHAWTVTEGRAGFSDGGYRRAGIRSW